jgi:hypothetical protein
VDVPDAPVASRKHGAICNTEPPNTTAKNAFPAGSDQRTNFLRATRNSSPCPQTGSHRYFFKLYALNLYVNARTTKTALMSETNEYIVTQTKLIRDCRLGDNTAGVNSQRAAASRVCPHNG